MSSSSALEPVASVDTTWLHMDDVANLMVVTLVLMFEEPIEFQRIRELVTTRLLKVPRFRQRVIERPQWIFSLSSVFGSGVDQDVPQAHRPGFQGDHSFGSPYWEDDPHFDINHHVEQAELEDPTDDSALHRLVSQAMSRPLDPWRPLWHFYFVPRYRGGCAVVARIHHCIGDGFGLIHAFLSMADNSESVAMACGATANGGASTSLSLTALGQAITGGLTATARLLLMGADPATELKGPLTVEKRATWSTPAPLDDVKAIGRKMGGSVNDVLLSAMTGALRRYLLTRGPVPYDLNVRGVIPVNLRSLHDAHQLGNRFGLVFLEMPVGLSDPGQRLNEIRRRMVAIKQSQEPAVTFQILAALGFAPPGVFDFIVRMFGQKATSVITNVIGPREAVTFAGVRLAQAMFWVPCAGNLGLGISILSYAGRVSVGFATDAGLIPDPDTIVEGFDAELAQLAELAREQQASEPALTAG